MAEQPVSRVLMTGDTVGGVWTFTMELAEALGAHGVDVVLATMGGEPDSEQRTAAAAIPNLQLMPGNYRLEWMQNPWEDVAESGRWLLGLEKRFSPDVVHLNSYGHGALPFEAPLLMTAHSCVLSWWAAVKGTPRPAEWDRYQREVESAIQAVDLLTAPSEAMLRTLKENYGSDLPARRVVLNGRSGRRYRALRKEPFILTAGRLWDEAKNVTAVARAAAGLSWPVYLAGEQRSPDGETVDLPGCGMLGRLSPEALAGWYGRAAIYALPARYEPFGLSVLEAALSGDALVLGDIDSLREIWRDAAIFVPPGDSTQLAAALRKLTEDQTLREDMAERSLARALTFTPERMASQYLEAYTSLVEQRRTACVS